MKILVQNLQKRSNLATELLYAHEPDVLLAQEIDLPSEESGDVLLAHHTSRLGYGTAIYCRDGYELTNVRRVLCPRAEVGGLARKKTTVATLVSKLPASSSSSSPSTPSFRAADDFDDDDEDENDNARAGGSDVTKSELVSFHGYNGRPFFTSVSHLVEHVSAVLSVLDPNLPAIFAGDFNTWTEAHMSAVSKTMKDEGFERIFSWDYPGRDGKVPLDHVFARGMRLADAEVTECASDHWGATLDLVELDPSETRPLSPEHCSEAP